MTWFVTGFEREGEAPTHEVDLDEAIESIIRRELQAEDSGRLVGPVSLNQAAVRRLDEMLGLDIDADRARYVLEYVDPDAYYDLNG